MAKIDTKRFATEESQWRTLAQFLRKKPTNFPLNCKNNTFVGLIWFPIDAGFGYLLTAIPQGPKQQGEICTKKNLHLVGKMLFLSYII